LWLIECHPEDDIQAPPLSPQFDSVDFTAARKLWEAHLAGEREQVVEVLEAFAA
jgi:hypothetical protein